MKVTLGTKAYDVRFKRNFRNVRGRKGLDNNGNIDRSKAAIDTECVISVVDPSLKGSVKYTPVACSNIKLHSSDDYDKLTGKKIAMTRALRGFSRPARTIFWDRFKAEFNAYLEDEDTAGNSSDS